MKLSFRWYGEDDKVTSGAYPTDSGYAVYRNSCLRCTCWRSLEPESQSQS